MGSLLPTYARQRWTNEHPPSPADHSTSTTVHYLSQNTSPQQTGQCSSTHSCKPGCATQQLALQSMVSHTAASVQNTATNKVHVAAGLLLLTLQQKLWWCLGWRQGSIWLDSCQLCWLPLMAIQPWAHGKASYCIDKLDQRRPPSHTADISV